MKIRLKVSQISPDRDPYKPNYPIVGSNLWVELEVEDEDVIDETQTEDGPSYTLSLLGLADVAKQLSDVFHRTYTISMHSGE